MSAPHTAGNALAADGQLLRIDTVVGRRMAARPALNLVVQQQLYGSDELVHQQVVRLLSHEGVH